MSVEAARCRLDLLRTRLGPGRGAASGALAPTWSLFGTGAGAKLQRTFAAQMSTLKEYRSKGGQKMTGQNVNVAEGGQAIVGNVSASPEGGGARKKVGDQPHAQLAYAPGVEMSRQPFTTGLAMI